MDLVVAFLSRLSEFWTAFGASLIGYPLVLVLAAYAGAVSLALAIVVLVSTLIRRRWAPWPWRVHGVTLLLVVGGTTIVHLDARVMATEGTVRGLALDQRLRTVELAAQRDEAGLPLPPALLQTAVLRERLAAVLGSFDLDVTRLDRGVEYASIRVTGPEANVVHVAVVDLTDPGVRIEITDSFGQKVLTSDFARQRRCLVAVNGEAGVSPAADAPLGRYAGNWVARGVPVMLEDTARRPFLAFDHHNRARYVPAAVVDTEPGFDKFNTIWGRGDVLRDGQLAIRERRRWLQAAPRTLMGIDAVGERLMLMVVDGRQPRFSVGLELATAAAVLAAFGATDAMWCDQGGSSTMVLGCLGGVVNQPSDGFERPVYAHFGVARDAAGASGDL